MIVFVHRLLGPVDGEHVRHGNEGLRHAYQSQRAEQSQVATQVAFSKPTTRSVEACCNEKLGNLDDALFRLQQGNELLPKGTGCRYRRPYPSRDVACLPTT